VADIIKVTIIKQTENTHKKIEKYLKKNTIKNRKTVEKS